MERLTERTAAGVANINYSGCYFDDGMRDKIAESARRQTVIERLASIEDILGEDYDLDRLRELVMAGREGRCVIIKKCHECKHHHTAYGYHYCRFWHKFCPDDGDFYCQYAPKGEAYGG